MVPNLVIGKGVAGGHHVAPGCAQQHILGHHCRRGPAHPMPPYVDPQQPSEEDPKEACLVRYSRYSIQYSIVDIVYSTV